MKSTQQNDAAVLLNLEGLDLSWIKRKMLANTAFGPELVDEIAVWYKRFLFLNYKYKDLKIVPNDLIDEFWHCHILDTQRYAPDSQLVFGYFLHHFPYFGMRGEDDRLQLGVAFEQTNKLFLSEFGEVPFASQRAKTLLSAGPAEASAQLKAASCSDCSGAAGTGT